MIDDSTNRVTLEQLLGIARDRADGDGMIMLFAGPAGTGKTMAAERLAGMVRRPLERVALGSVVSKYIGETEKNLAKAFDRAAANDAILMFDEADALFGKRSEVKDAHDRYANVETNYLLQRLAEHRGIAILTTNSARGIDPALRRRIRFVIDFPVPS